MDNFKQKKDDVIELHISGHTKEEISKITGLLKVTISSYISSYNKQEREKEGYFNIDKYKCWLAPTSTEKNLRY